MAGDDDLLHGDELFQNKHAIRELATRQLLHAWERQKDRHGDPFLWGDEIECLLLHLEHDGRSVSLEQAPWQQLERVQSKHHDDPSLQPELGAFMLETTPSRPFGSEVTDVLKWQDDLAKRRRLVDAALPQNSRLVTLPYYPRYGAEEGSRRRPYSPAVEKNPVTWSSLVTDEHIASNARYLSILGNIVQKRGKKVEIHIPLYRDVRTPWPWKDAKDARVRKNSIFMDSTLFGATGCSLQVTMQAKNLNEARRLHDGLVPLAPVMLALTAGTPVFRGLLADTDTRWACFEQSVDDRSPEEVESGKPARSRVSSCTTYISQEANQYEHCHIQDLEHDPKVKKALQDGGMDELMAIHFAYLLARDPLFASSQDLKSADISRTTMCDGLLAGMYQTIRLKPAENEGAGWRVEFRPMESQVTDFENAAFCVFVILIARMIIESGHQFYVPLPDVEKGMVTACQRNAATEGRFTFRCNSIAEPTSRPGLLTANEIICGKQGGFEGLMKLLSRGEASQHFSTEQWAQIEIYLRLVMQRTTGAAPTTAAWIRSLIDKHEAYKQDSVVPDRVVYDLVQECIRRNEVV
ncbi:uncharacterized protein HMPREF1541_07933 [Cyphellophora europaea CBS 101466]|uniref:Glutamate--cysteine ligase n=1 Tax=Cyphellophora europaea (strain CBS 101466) TaxID=1220924 RepID=W2RKF7_CYPE1|nr:uncharacterized protein HMPREF1541_07933 [Cyphellophora europaea CBS 101466]ETN36946.1 hypothetical protein HMPREF1541_07933 [Cyphellophora europaea CBS 101466]